MADSNEEKLTKVLREIRDPKFDALCRKILDLGLDINPDALKEFYANLFLYTEDVEAEYDLALGIRELGSRCIDNKRTPVSRDVATIVFENYFIEWSDNNLGFIVNEIKRICKGRLNCEVVSETKYDPKKDHNNISISLKIEDELFTIEHEAPDQEGAINPDFLIQKLFPLLKNTLHRGKLIYKIEESVNLIYFEEEEKIERFKSIIKFFQVI